MSLNYGFSEEKQSLAAVEKCFQISSHNSIDGDFLSLLDDVQAKVDAYNAESLSQAGCLRELVEVDKYGNKTYSYNDGKLLKNPISKYSLSKKYLTAIGGIIRFINNPDEKLTEQFIPFILRLMMVVFFTLCAVIFGYLIVLLIRR